MTDSAELPVPLHALDPGLAPPAYAQRGDAGADLRTAVDVTLAPGERALVPTGVALAIPEGHAGFVHPRSGLAVRHGLSVVNAPGTIDAGYRGEIRVILINHGTEVFRIEPGMRIAQLVVCPVLRVTVEEVEQLDETRRGAGGFGSTGL